MALSGSTTLRSVYHWHLKFSWTATQNVGANTSAVAWQVIFSIDSGWPIHAGARTGSVTVNGAKTNFNFTARSEGGSIVVARGTTTIGHNSDGNKTFGVSAVLPLNFTSSTYGYISSLTGSASYSLNKIARAYSFIISEATHEMDTPLTVKINNNGSGFSARLRISFGSKEVFYPVGNIGGNFRITPKASDFAPIIPNANSGWGGIHLDTYNGNTKIGTYAISPFTMTVPASANPTVKSVTIADPLSGVPAKLGIENTVNLFVRKYSNIRLDVMANESYSSPIKSWAFSCDGKAILTNNGPLNDIPLSQYDLGVGAKVIKCVMTDGRGRSVSEDITVNIQDYAAPALTSLSAERIDGGTTVQFTKGGKIYSIKNGTTELNTYTTVTKYKLTTATAWTVGKEENNACATFTIGTFAVDKSYDILIEIKDKLETRQYTYVISTAKVLIDLYQNEGVGIGKMREKGSLDIAGDVYINNRKLIDMFYPVGAIFESTNSTDPATFMGGTWERFGNGRVTVGVDENDSDFSAPGVTAGAKDSELRALIGAYNNNTRTLAYAAGSPVAGEGHRSIWLKGMSNDAASAVTRINHTVLVKGTDGKNMPRTQPSIAVYRWRRTA